MPITTILGMYVLELFVQRKLQGTKAQSISLIPGSGSVCTASLMQHQQEGENHVQLLRAPPARRHRAAAKEGEGCCACLVGSHQQQPSPLLSPLTRGKWAFAVCLFSHISEPFSNSTAGHNLHFEIPYANPYSCSLLRTLKQALLSRYFFC